MTKKKKKKIDRKAVKIISRYTRRISDSEQGVVYVTTVSPLIKKTRGQLTCTVSCLPVRWERTLQTPVDCTDSAGRRNISSFHIIGLVRSQMKSPSSLRGSRAGGGPAKHRGDGPRLISAAVGSRPRKKK